MWIHISTCRSLREPSGQKINVERPALVKCGEEDKGADETDLPEDKKRGDNYILVYKIIGNPEKIIQIEAGYNYKLNQDIVVKIDNTNFKFYTTEDVSDSAWTDKDSDVIFAMKKGLDLIVTGESSRGTITNDKYTLKGFTAAFNKLSTDCK